MGVVIDGCPAEVPYDEKLLITKLKQRRPGFLTGGKNLVSERREPDKPEVLSGIFENKTLGTPIAVIVRNRDQKPRDYESVKKQARVGHADDVWKNKFGHRDHRGGGRASARETLNWVIASAFAQMFCQSENPKIKVKVKLLSVGEQKVSGPKDKALVKKLIQAKTRGESFGARISINIKNPKAFIGEPVFGKLKADLARAFMTINACCGVELGGGFAMSESRGREVHREMTSKIYGGIRGGIATGETIEFCLAFKPTASIKDFAKTGRHDPCVALRALPIVEAMAWNVLGRSQPGCQTQPTEIKSIETQTSKNSGFDGRGQFPDFIKSLSVPLFYVHDKKTHLTVCGQEL